MAYGYVIAQIDVTDPEAYAAYIAQVPGTVSAFGGEYIVRGGTSASVEGQAPGGRTAVIRFASYARALEWYGSEAYAPLRAMRQGASKGVVTIIEGV